MKLRVFLQHPLTPVAALILCLLLSAAAAALWGGRTYQAVFYYPVDNSTAVDAERRPVVRKSERHEDIRTFLEEWHSGPVTLAYGRPLVGRRPFRNVLVDGRTLYVDIRHEAFEEPDTGQFRDPSATEELIRLNVMRNFPRIEEVRLTVDGQVPGSSYYDRRR